MNQRHLSAALGERRGRLDAEQPAADHRDAPPLLRRSAQARQVGEVAESDDPGQIGAGNGQANGRRTGGEDDAVEGQRAAVGEARDPAREVERRNRDASHQPDARTPAGIVEREFGVVDLAGQRRRQQHAVVGRVGLGADQRHVVAAWRTGHQLVA